MTVLIRSGGIVEEVWLTGMRPPSGSSGASREPSVAVHEVLADQRLLAHRARARPLRSASKPGSVTSAVTITRYGSVLREAEAGRLPGLDAADLEVAALDEPERVVELDLVGLERALGVAGAREHARPPRPRRRRRAPRARASLDRPRGAVGVDAVELLLLGLAPDVRAVLGAAPRRRPGSA